MGMNTGMDIASGEYIGIVEPDDFVPLTMYEDLYNIAKDNELDFVKADFYRFTRDSRTGELNLVYNRLDPSGENYNQVISPFEKPYVTKFIMNTWSGIYRRQFIEEHHIRHNTTPGAAFQDNGFFWQTFMYAKRCMFLDRPYYMNRRDNPNSSVKNKEKVYTSLCRKRMRNSGIVLNIISITSVTSVIFLPWAGSAKNLSAGMWSGSAENLKEPGRRMSSISKFLLQILERR